MVQLSPQIEVDKTDVEGVQLHLDPGGQVRGKFRLDTGEKFDWTQLNLHLLPVVENETTASPLAMVEMANPRADTHSMVSADGTFEMGNVPGGSYQLVIGAQSNDLRDYYTKSVMQGGKDVADSGFTVNGDVSLDVVVSAKGATIEGTWWTVKARLRLTAWLPWCPVRGKEHGLIRTSKRRPTSVGTSWCKE
jgi:hypothetical protein